MPSLVVGTAGHIDHGKSSLVLALTGTDPDRLKEEKERGITIELGFAHFEHQGINFALVDVPGHERFVRQMLAGASGIDAVLLVVAADESVMPQTREHFEICRLLGVRTGLIALTKADLVDADTLELCRLELRELVQGSFLEDAPVVPVSARTGEGLDALRAALVDAAAKTAPRAEGGVVRLPIDRAFSMRGFGTIVTGTLSSGNIRPDEALTLLPAGREVKVRGVQVHGRAAEAAHAGQRTAVNVAGLDVADVARGDVLATPGLYTPTRRADLFVEMLAGAAPLKHGARVRFHQGTTETLGRVALGPQPSLIRIRLEKPTVLTRGDRFILRAYSPTITVGGGTVLDPHPPRGGLRTSASAARLERIGTHGDPMDVVLAFIAERGLSGLHEEELVGRAGLTPREASDVADRLKAEGRAAAVGPFLVGTDALSRNCDELTQMVARHHATAPLAAGLPREEARERLFARAAAGVFEHAVAMLERGGKLVARDTLALPGHQVELSDEESRARDRLVQTYRTSGLAPPDARSAASEAGVDQAVWDRVSKLLVREKTLVRIDQLLFDAEALEGLKRDVRARKAAGETRIDIAHFKERYGVTRKFAIPLLEYLDRERVTRRMGDARVIL